MAGDWVKIEKVTPEKPEVEGIADILDIDPDAVFGKLFRLWAWFDDHTTDGNATSVTKKLVDRKTGVNGFAEAMQRVGWLSESGGILSLPNFDRHNGKTAKKRALTAKRVAKSKQKSNADTNADTNAEVTPSALPREEKRREENKSNYVTSSEEKPASGYSFPIKKSKGHNLATWVLLQSDFNEYAEVYANQLNLPAELRKARLWLESNPQRRKTAGGMKSFLTNWLNRASNKWCGTTTSTTSNAADDPTGNLGRFAHLWDEDESEAAV